MHLELVEVDHFPQGLLFDLVEQVVELLVILSAELDLLGNIRDVVLSALLDRPNSGFEVADVLG